MSKMKKVAFVGSGLIGTGLAINSVLHGLYVCLQTRSQTERVKNQVQGILDFYVSNEICSAEKAKEALTRIQITTSIEEAVKDADFIQESGPDNLTLKRELIAEIEKYANDTAIIATSTSSLLITDVFAQAENPQRCVGGHPYLPAHLIPLIEVTKGAQTSQETIAGACDFYSYIGKEPVVLNKEVAGFIANRLQSAIHREVVDLVMNDVCSVEDADKALVYSVGMRWGIMGQFLTMHLGASPEGIGKFNEKYGILPGVEDKRLKDMPRWTIFPENWDKKAEQGISDEINHRPVEQGRTIKEIEQWRDHMLLEYLKLHNKLQLDV